MATNKQIFNELAKLTYDRCKSTCKIMGSCCSNEYCRIAEEYAKSKRVKLIPTGNGIKYLNDKGICVVPPHLRPFCTLHHCEIGAVGHFKGNKRLTDRYFRLRESIKEL